MKSCAYCRRENTDDALVCCECGTSLDLEEPKPELKLPRQPIPWQEIPGNPMMIFRTLVVFSTTLYVVLTFYLLVGARLVPGELWSALGWHGYGARFLLPQSVAWLIFLLNLAVAVGLWNFSRSARVVFVVLVVLDCITALLGGLQVNLAFGSMVSLLIALADGAILFAAHMPPLKEKFE